MLAASPETSEIFWNYLPIRIFLISLNHGVHVCSLLCRSVRTFAEDFRKKNLPLHILGNNASSWMVPDAMSPTEDGFEVLNSLFISWLWSEILQYLAA